MGGQRGARAQAPRDGLSGISPLYLPYSSALSPLYLRSISAISPLYLLEMASQARYYLPAHTRLSRHLAAEIMGRVDRPRGKSRHARR